MDRVTLKNLRIYTHVGCTSEERRVGQHLEVDIEFRLDLRDAGKTDRISASIDYAHAAVLVREAVSGVEANLLEAVAQRAADALAPLGARTIIVRVRKPSPPIPGAHADHAEVEIVRNREERL
jgi:dihydroneopterin aldolase